MSGQIPTTQINGHVVCDDTSRTLTPPRALDRSRIACDLESVEVLLKLNGAAVADRPDVEVRRIFQYLRWYSRSIGIIPSNHRPHLGNAPIKAESRNLRRKTRAEKFP